MSMTNYTCIKPDCDNTYDSEEAEAYYCPSCTKANAAIAKRIDAQIAARPRKAQESAFAGQKESVRKGQFGQTIQGVDMRVSI